MKRKLGLLVVIALSVTFGWTSAYLRLPYVDENYSFWIGIICFASLLLVFVLLLNIWNKQAVIIRLIGKKQISETSRNSGLTVLKLIALVFGLGLSASVIGHLIINGQVEEQIVINQKQKTLVFCATQIHAAAVRDLINQHSESNNPNYCHRVTANDGALGERHLRDFQDNEKSIPTVLTTSQKLSTGVDAPEIRNIVLMRPVNSMIEFKQIVGRGTRLFEGKDHFTIFDFVEAHKHFQDPEWDGPPLPPEDPVERKPKKPFQFKEENDVVLDNFDEDEPVKKIIKVTLADSTVREIDSMVKTTFWSPEGKPISYDEFIKSLFGEIPNFFKSEQDLINIWSNPDTRKKLLDNLSEAGYTTENLEELRKIIHAEDSDLFDVLSYVAYHSNIIPRLDRSLKAKIHLKSYNAEQQEFLNFVLEQYVKKGVKELDKEKLAAMIELKYKTVADAKQILGDPKITRDIFIGFQKYLYNQIAI